MFLYNLLTESTNLLPPTVLTEGKTTPESTSLKPTHVGQISNDTIPGKVTCFISRETYLNNNSCEDKA